MRTLFALLMLLVLPVHLHAEAEEGAVSVQALLTEADTLAQEARSRHAAAHDMKPSAERNEILSKARVALKQAIGKYELLGDLSTEHRKHATAQVGDLKGLLFWCNKSFAVIVPPRLTTPPPPPIQESVPEPDKPPPPPLPPPFSEADKAEVLRLLGVLKGLHEKVEDAGDRIAQAKAAIADLYAVLEASHTDWEAKGGAVGWNQVKAYEARRDAMLADTRKHQKQIQARLKEIRRLQDEIRGGQSLLEWFGPPSLPTLAGWVAQAPDGSLPETLVTYVNRQMEAPAWGFTRLDEAAAAPAEAALDPAKAAACRKGLDEAAKLYQRDVDLEVALAEGEVERDRLEREIADLTAHWAWRQEHSAWSMDHLKLMEQRKGEARKAVEKLAASAEKARAERAQIAAKLQPLAASLETLDPSMARVVESWRRKRSTVPAALEEILERWTRRIAG